MPFPIRCSVMLRENLGIFPCVCLEIFSHKLIMLTIFDLFKFFRFSI